MTVFTPRSVTQAMMMPNLLALGIVVALAPPSALAQSSAANAADLDTVTVTGIRGSLQSSMNLKRDTVGVLDGIIAEDIGKFPDTNLAESMQRISGVSIDRTITGEGSRVTVRGIGADFNQVLLNGRQMPASNLGPNGSGISGSRAFDFSNLASEAVSALEVYKTARADTPTGGIGATINIKTARPFDSSGMTASLGIKGVMDTSVDNLPSRYPGKSLTPEISGIFSNTYAGGRFGIAANFSYQQRDSAYSQARVNQGWDVFRGDDTTTIGRLPQEDDPEYKLYDITDRPAADALYARPRNFMYLVSSSQRQRRNGQITLQYAPTDTLTATLDYTYADNRLQQQRNELQVVLNPHGPGASTWTKGPISAPTLYTQYAQASGAPRDLSLAMAQVWTRSELESVGFNLEWAVNDALDLQFDYHNSSAEARPDNPHGSANFLITTAPVLGKVTVDFSSALPILIYELAPGINQLGPEHARMNGSGFRSSFNWSEVEQFQVGGSFRFADYQAVDFGVTATEVFNRAATANTSGVPANIGTADDFADDLWYVDNMGRYFNSFPGHNDARLTDRFLGIDFERLRDRAIELTGRPDWYTSPSQYNQDLRTTEKTRSAYLQWRNTYDVGMVPVSVAAGIRYEKTEVDSPALVSPPAGNLIWENVNDLRVNLLDTPIAGDFTGEYDYWLPSFDVRADLRDDLVLRASYSKSIGRAGWRDIQGGLSVIDRYPILGGVGNQGNPGLLPLESKNLDFSLEWYYGEGSYVSAGYFRKSLKNFIGNDIIRQSPYPITSPIGGTYWMNAINSGISDSDLDGIREYIFTNHANDPGVDAVNRIITGQPGDPAAIFDIQTPTNQRSDKLDGWEVNLQHMFGDSGFGISANYTKVDSGLHYDNLQLGAQFPMIGLSDSANLVVFYDKYDWQIRAAYNWRDEFLSSTGGTAGTAINPNYTESYGQLDVNVTWQVNEKLSVFVEAINLTDETQRIYNRHKNMLFSASQTGPRYMFGARYKF